MLSKLHQEKIAVKPPAEKTTRQTPQYTAPQSVANLQARGRFISDSELKNCSLVTVESLQQRRTRKALSEESHATLFRLELRVALRSAQLPGRVQSNHTRARAHTHHQRNFKTSGNSHQTRHARGHSLLPEKAGGSLSYVRAIPHVV